MDIIMMDEGPLFKKCCFFIPLRLCLQTWAIVKLVANMLATCCLVFLTVFLYSFNHRGFFKELSVYHWTSMMVVFLLVDMGFLITLQVGVFKKSIKILRVIYLYKFYSMTVEFVVILILLANLYLTNSFKKYYIYAILGVLYISLDECICITSKYEIIKLRIIKEQYDFSKMADIEETGKFEPEE